MFIRDSWGNVAADAWQTATGSTGANTLSQGRPTGRRSVRGDSAAHTVTSKRSMEIEAWSTSRRMTLHVLETQGFEILMGLVILFNMGVMVTEVNHDAACLGGGSGSGACKKDSSTLFSVMNCVFLAIYVTEVGARMFTYRRKFTQRAWNLVDLVIVVAGCIDTILDFSPVETGAHKLVLRLFRVGRLARGVRLLVFFPQLNQLILLLGGALTPLTWGFVLILLMILFWSIVAVEFINPVMERISFGSDDEVCKDIFTSVWQAALFFFQTHIAQDAWGSCIIPIIQQVTGTALVFVASIISVQLGLLNIIVCAVLDSACAAREQDHLQRAVENRQIELKRLEDWREIFLTVDANNDGQISLRELLDGFDIEENVREYLTALNINRDDLRYIFNLMDVDSSGDLSYNELVNTFVKAQSQDQRIYLMTVKLQTEHILQTLRQQGDALQAIYAAMGCVDDGRVESATEAMCRRRLQKLDLQDQLEQSKSSPDETSDETSTMPSARGTPLDQAAMKAAAKSPTTECMAASTPAHVQESTGVPAAITTDHITSSPVVHSGMPSPTFAGHPPEVAAVPEVLEESKGSITPRVSPRWLSDIGEQAPTANNHVVLPTSKIKIGAVSTRQQGQGVEIPDNKLKYVDIDQHQLAEDGPPQATRGRSMGVMFSTFESMAPVWTANGNIKREQQAPPGVDELNRVLPPHSGRLRKSASSASSMIGITGRMKPPGTVQKGQELTSDLAELSYPL